MTLTFQLGGFSRYVGAGSKKRMNLKVGEDTLSKMWNGVRVNNGIMVSSGRNMF